MPEVSQGGKVVDIERLRRGKDRGGEPGSTANEKTPPRVSGFFTGPSELGRNARKCSAPLPRPPRASKNLPWGGVSFSRVFFLLRGVYCDEVSSSAHRRSMNRRISSFIFVPATVQAILKRRCCSRGRSTVRREFPVFTRICASGLTGTCFSVSFPTPPLTKVSISSDVGCLLGSGFVRSFLLIEHSDFLHNS